MPPHFNRALVFLHRWGGIALAPVVVLWFLSGVVTMYVGYPKLTPTERLARLPPLQPSGCCIPLAEARRALPAAATPRSAVLTSIAGQPAYRFELSGRFAVVDAISGRLLPAASPDRALASARAFMPQASARYVALVDEDIWTRGSRLNPYRPLHRVQMGDPARTILYVSSATGEVVRDASDKERMWNYVGPWLHWLHAFRSPDAMWRMVIIGFSVAALLLAATGFTLGILRWRFTGRYASGRRTPYRQPFMRWHHVVGLLFACITLTWIFSGLMSIDPWGVFSSHAKAHGAAHGTGEVLEAERFAVDARQALAEIGPGVAPRELEWRTVDGEPYIVAYDVAGRTRILPAATGSRGPWLTRFQVDTLARSASRLLPGAAILEIEELRSHDAYYYGRSVHTLRGADSRRLPVLRVKFDDASNTWAYVDTYTGALVLTQSAGERTQRWLFCLLHSWDLPQLLAARPAWDAALIVLSLGGLALSITGTVLGYRRLRMNLG